jgi:hypothetical protein
VKHLHLKRDIQRERKRKTKRKSKKNKARAEEKCRRNQKKPRRAKTVDTYFTKRDEKSTDINQNYKKKKF